MLGIVWPGCGSDGSDPGPVISEKAPDVEALILGQDDPDEGVGLAGGFHESVKITKDLATDPAVGRPEGGVAGIPGSTPEGWNRTAPSEASRWGVRSAPLLPKRGPPQTTLLFSYIGKSVVVSYNGLLGFALLKWRGIYHSDQPGSR